MNHAELELFDHAYQNLAMECLSFKEKKDLSQIVPRLKKAYFLAKSCKKNAKKPKIGCMGSDDARRLITYPELINSFILGSLKLQLSNISGQCDLTVCHISSFSLVFSKLYLPPRKYINIKLSSKIEWENIKVSTYLLYMYLGGIKNLR